MSSRFQRPRDRATIAPVHRGPQALPPGASAAPYSGGFGMHAPNAALLIDFDNVTMGIQKDMQAELRNLMSSDIIKGKVSVQRAYADWRRYPGYIVPLTEASIDLIFAPAYGSAKKNATDIRLAIDAMELVFTRPEIGTFILLSGDSDFSSLVIKLKEYGKYVIGVGIRESSSDLLVQNCDEYYSYNALAGLVRAGDEELVRWDPWELVTEAIGKMSRNGDVMRADRLKQVMQDIDPNFDEKDLGMSKFSRFVHEAEKRRLITLTRMENGQYEIGPVGAAAAPAAPATPESRPAPRREDRPAAAAPAVEPEEAESVEVRDARLAREERGRGRRGRRGRGRDFERGPRTEATGEFETVAAPPEAPAIEAPAPAPVTPAAPTIGISGERLTRNEAFDLVRRAVESLVSSDEDSVGAPQVRQRAFELLGRDSESLGERMFERILRDAHDADLIDLRRRGDTYELGRAAQAESVADQLNRAAAAQAATATPATPAAAAPRGMGPRGLARGRTAGRGAAPPPELLSIGVVSVPSFGASPVSAATTGQATPAPEVSFATPAAQPAALDAAAEQPPVPLEDGGAAAAPSPAEPGARRGGRGRRGGRKTVRGANGGHRAAGGRPGGGRAGAGCRGRADRGTGRWHAGGGREGGRIAPRWPRSIRREGAGQDRTGGSGGDAARPGPCRGQAARSRTADAGEGGREGGRAGQVRGEGGRAGSPGCRGRTTPAASSHATQDHVTVRRTAAGIHVPAAGAPYPPAFYDRDPRDVARDLLGAVLVCRTEEGTASGIVVETEAYLGADDPACHAVVGRTARTWHLFGPPGTAYVYRIYGMHWCVNAVTLPEGIGSAVLVRALAPIDGLTLMRERRPRAVRDRDLTNGPGKLCAALGIDGRLDGARLDGDALVLRAGTPVPDARVDVTPRIGITRGAALPYRYLVRDDPYVSATPRAFARRPFARRPFGR